MSNNDDKKNLVIGINEIKRLIPHRYPFLMIDKVIDLTNGIKATGIKNVTFNEPHFTGHFPEQPVMPGVLVVEAMAQTAAVLVANTLGLLDHKFLVYFLSHSLIIHNQEQFYKVEDQSLPLKEYLIIPFDHSLFEYFQRSNQASLELTL